MTTLPNLNESETTLLKIKTRIDEIKNLKYQTEKHDLEIILKLLKIDSDYYKKKCKSSNKKKVLLIITQTLSGSASTKSSSTLAPLKTSAGNII